ncbi:MAG: AglZ/HisF2 family acetamidino modification protein [Flavobacteriia bacterium]
MALEARIIPVLLLHKGGLYKTKQFKNPKYVGDPINAVRIFNEKEVDELMILDIDCSKENKEPNYTLIEEIVSEAFMPIGYGGGVASLAIAKKIFQLGVEKVIINSALQKKQQLLAEIAAIYGAQAVAASIDYKKGFIGGTKAYFNNGTNKSGYTPQELALIAEKAGAGEIILNAIDREGTYQGFDINLLQQVVASVQIPVVVSGGANGKADFDAAKQFGASGMAAGSMFVYQRPHNAVLISYPSNYFYL